MTMKTTEKHVFTEEDFDACSWRYKSYFIDVLNGEYDLTAAREDLLSLIGSEFDKRIKPDVNLDYTNEQGK